MWVGFWNLYVLQVGGVRFVDIHLDDEFKLVVVGHEESWCKRSLDHETRLISRLGCELCGRLLVLGRFATVIHDYAQSGKGAGKPERYP